jgi:hypothetical protein
MENHGLRVRNRLSCVACAAALASALLGCSSVGDGAASPEDGSGGAAGATAGTKDGGAAAGGTGAAGVKGTGGTRDGGQNGAGGVKGTGGAAGGSPGTGGSQGAGGGAAGSQATGGAAGSSQGTGGVGNRTDGGSAALGLCDPAKWQIADLPPVGTPGVDYASDLQEQAGPWNGLGPIEKDRSNGGASAGDGGPLVINGVCYPKGFGMRAPAGIKYGLGGRYKRFVSDTGLDFVANSNTVIFHVIVDGNYLADYEIHTKSDTKSLDIDVTGRNVIEIGVRDCWDTTDDDFSVWGGARLIQ